MSWRTFYLSVQQDCLADVDESLADEVLIAWQQGHEWSAEEPRFQRVAYRLALALGRCIVYGVKLPEDIDGVLPYQVAIAAAKGGTALAVRMAEKARQLTLSWDDASPAAAEDLCAGMLETRHDLWCAMQAVYESYECLLEESATQLGELESALDSFGEACEQLDDILQREENLALLSTLVELPLLDNWRRALAEPYRTIRPWWLSGILEHVANRVAQTVQQAYTNLEVKVRCPPAAAKLRYGHSPLWLLEVQEQPALAAASEAPLPPVRAILKWRSPAADAWAHLSVPSTANAETVLPLELVDESGNPLLSFAGKQVQLSGVVATIEADAVARIPLRQIRECLQRSQAPEEARLVLTIEGEDWVPVNE